MISILLLSLILLHRLNAYPCSFLFVAGNAGHGFTPHVITVAEGEVWKLSNLGLYYYYQKLVGSLFCIYPAISFACYATEKSLFMKISSTLSTICFVFIFFYVLHTVALCALMEFSSFSDLAGKP